LPQNAEPGLSPEEFSRLCEPKPQLENIDYDAEFEFGLDLIVSGLRDRL